MNTLSYGIKLRFVKILNVLGTAAPVVWCWLRFCAPFASFDNAFLSAIITALVFMLVYTNYGHIYGGFSMSTVRISEMLYSQCLALVMSDGIIYAVMCLAVGTVIKVWIMLFVLGKQMLVSVIWCVAAHRWYFKAFPPKKTAVIYGHDNNVKALTEAYGFGKKFDVKAVVDAHKCIDDSFCSLAGMDTVFILGVHSRERNVIIKHCVKSKIEAYVLPGIGDLLLSGAKKINMFHLPLLRVNGYSPSPEYLFAKRAFDIVVSAAAIVILLPVMLISALAIKLTDFGPVFYTQKRLTKNGKEFSIIKFRSMRADAEKDGVARLSTGEGDLRVTPVGRILRKFRIDELPQLFNILGGSMSLVGPRPERPEIAREYEKELPEFALRLQAKAGLTGYAQVYGKYNTTPYNKLQMDLMYLAHPSFIEDLRILFATVKTLFMPDSTEGVEEGMETALKKRENAANRELEV